MRKWIGKGHTPEVGRRFSVAAPRREATQPPNGMPDGKPGRKGVTRRQGRHLVFTQEPPRYDERGNQPAREHTACLQSIERKNLAQVLAVHVARTPIKDHVEN